MNIPLTKPFWGKSETAAIVRALKDSTGVGDGPFTKKLTVKLRELTGSRYVLPVTSCTHGLELAMAALSVGPGDEVIIPSFTMTSTGNCVALRGAKPVFAEIETGTFGLDPEDVARKITPKTRGIIVVHYAGMPVNLEAILKLTKKHRLFLVEDAAHAIGAYYGKKMLGTFGDAGVYSFHGTKNIACGEGGAVVTDRRDLFEKMEIYRANGTNRNAYLRGQVDKYSWVGMGSSFFLSDLLAALALAQLDRLEIINRKRTRIARVYTRKLDKFIDRLELPGIPKDTTPNWHIYALLFRERSGAEKFFRQMRQAGIEVSYHYVPLHSSGFGRIVAGPVKLPLTDSVSKCLVRLPIYPDLTAKEIKFITDTACRILSDL